MTDDRSLGIWRATIIAWLTIMLMVGLVTLDRAVRIGNTLREMNERQKTVVVAQHKAIMDHFDARCGR